MNPKLFENFDKSIEKFKKIDFAGFNVEDPDPNFLNLECYDLDTHLIAQPGCLAYFSQELSRAESELRAIKKDAEIWMMTKKIEAEAQIQGSDSEKSRVSDEKKEARVYINSAQEAKTREDKTDVALQWQEKIRIAEEYRDKVKFWFEGFNSKNYILPLYCSRQTSEQRAVSSYKKTPVEGPITRIKSELKSEFMR